MSLGLLATFFMMIDEKVTVGIRRRLKTVRTASPTHQSHRALKRAWAPARSCGRQTKTKACGNTTCGNFCKRKRREKGPQGAVGRGEDILVDAVGLRWVIDGEAAEKPGCPEALEGEGPVTARRASQMSHGEEGGSLRADAGEGRTGTAISGSNTFPSRCRNKLQRQLERRGSTSAAALVLLTSHCSPI